MPPSQQATTQFIALTQDEAETLAAIADRIFPPTDTPGATEIGAVRYIDVALGGDYAPLTRLYRRGIRAVNRYARAKFGRLYPALNEAEKDAVLLAFEAGPIAGFKNAAEFFETVRCHVLEGIFCEPQYGGNKGMIGWRLVGFPGQQFGYMDAYIDRPVELEPIAVDSTKSDEQKS